MAKEISQLLKEATKDILTPETLLQIQEAFDSAVTEKASLNVESALVKQDAEYTEKLKHLLEAIDKDHTKKLERVVEAIDLNNSAKLETVVKKYRKEIDVNASAFKKTLVEKVSQYIGLRIEDKIPQKMIEEAVKNKKAAVILNKLRESLAIDSALMNSSLKEAIVDGKTQIDESKETITKLTKQITVLKESVEREKANFILEQKTANLPANKKQYTKRVLADKSPKFILENIDYTISLFEKKEQEVLENIKEEAFESRTVTTDASSSDDIIEEETEKFGSQLLNTYISELQRY